jgi:hypothetical protein
MDEINDYCDSLIVEIESLIEKKVQKFDISGDIDDLKYKLNLLVYVKEKVIERNEKEKSNNFSLFLKLIISNCLTFLIKKIKIDDKILEYYFKLIENIFEKCEKIKSNKNLDVLFLFHQFNLEDNEKISNYIIENCKRYSSTRFAIGYYFKSNWFSIIYKLCLADFNITDKFMIREVKMNEIKNEIIYLTWKNQKKLVINIGKEKYLNEFFQTKCNILLEKMEINFEKYFINSKEFEQIHGIFNFLSELVLNYSNINYYKELQFLKRHQFKSQDEYLNAKETKYYKYSQFEKENEMFKIDIKMFNQSKISILDLNNCFDKGYNYDIYFERKTVEPSVNAFVRSSFYHQWFSFSPFERKHIWLEIINNEESFMRILNIHLTTKSYVDKFNNLLNEKKTKMPLINISKIGLGRYKDVLFFANFVDLDSKYINIQKQDSQTNDIIDAISHYSYQTSEGSLVVFDIRPIKINNSILITEPIIFSILPNTFSSSNLGLKGIAQFKANHICNKVCKELEFEKLI